MTFAKSGRSGRRLVRYEEIFNVQPFGNSLVTMTLTGAQIDTMLEQQFDNPGTGQNRVLSLSTGSTYSWTASAAIGSKVDPTIKIDGRPLDPTATYRVTVNSFLATGGDTSVDPDQGTNRLGGAVDLDAVEAVLRCASGPVSAPAQNRITRAPVARRHRRDHEGRSARTGLRHVRRDRALRRLALASDRDPSPRSDPQGPARTDPAST